MKFNKSGNEYQTFVPARLKKVAFLGSFPPRQCGIATFTCDVIQSVTYQSPAIEPIVIAMEEPRAESEREYPEMVKFVLPQNERSCYLEAAKFINRSGAQLLCVQHEFGLFGGEAGEWLLDILEQVRIPVVTVFHTVLPEPAPEYYRVTRELTRVSQQVVVLTNTAAQIIQQVYKVPGQKLSVIYHGVPNVPFMPTQTSKALLGLGNRTVLSTFGLINKGKGIEYAIKALPPVVERHPELIYLVLGGTHPLVRKHEGERYRESLEALVRQLGLEKHVHFENRYLDFDDLCRYLKATDIYLTPYLGREQIVSGTLAYALGFGKAIISTPYLYAKEALGDGRGVLVDWQESSGITAALLRWLDNPAQLAQVQRTAYNYGHEMAWPKIGRQYLNLFETLVTKTNPLLMPTKSIIKPAHRDREIKKPVAYA
jgi:glycosyltransferase involved in cell wall biosynthesis